MTLAATRASAPTGTAAVKQAASGLASFSSDNFSITDGFVSFKSGGILYANIQNVAADRILGNLGASPASMYQVTPEEILKRSYYNLSVTKSAIGGTEYLYTFNRGASETASAFTASEVSTSGANSSIVKTTSTGLIDVKGLKLAGANAITVDTGTGLMTFTTPGAFDFATVSGTSGENTTLTIPCIIDNSTGTLVATTLQTDVGGNGTTAGNIIGTWQVGSTSTIDFAANNGTLKTKTLTTGLAATAGTVTGTWTLTTGSAWESTFGADLAEYYAADDEYESGTVLVFGGSSEVTTTDVEADAAVAGVVSSISAFRMNTHIPGPRALIALAGRVPVKVIGTVRRGEMLTTSTTPGYACRAASPTVGTIIGKAIEAKTTEGMGVIEVAIGRL
jgi:hypothetical protein